MLASFITIVAAILENSYLITSSSLEPIGEGMKSAASAALPVGIGVMAVTAGIPIAKKIIKQLGR